MVFEKMRVEADFVVSNFFTFHLFPVKSILEKVYNLPKFTKKF